MTDNLQLVATFDRIGRSHNVAPLTLRAGISADEMAEDIYRYARPRLASKDVEVLVDLETMDGAILCGFHCGGRFTLTEAP